MYLRLTTRCNMHCAHCGLACTAEGQDMSLSIFRKALSIASDHGTFLTLGGGEPTLHPQFEKMLLEAIAANESEHAIAVITNGKITKRAMMLANLAKKCVIEADLSQDQWHDPIDPRVVEAFKDVGYRTVEYEKLVPVGRAFQLLAYDEDDPPSITECICDEWFVQPDGKIYQCGCPDSPQIGSVDDGVDSLMDLLCWRHREFQEFLEERSEESLVGHPAA